MKLLVFSCSILSKALIEFLHQRAILEAVVVPSNRVSENKVKELIDFLNNIGITILYLNAKNKNKHLVDFIKKNKIRMGISWAFSNYIEPDVYNSMDLGVINFHAGLLPQFRGCHINNWVMINDEKYTGVTIHKIDEGYDSGKILLQQKIYINDEDDANTLRNKTNEVATRLIIENIDKLLLNEIIGISQDENKSFYYKKRKFEDGIINFNMTSRQIFNTVRGLVKPFPGAYFEYNDTKFIVYKAKQISLDDKSVKENGFVTKVSDDYIRVYTSDGVIELMHIEVNGEKIIASDFFQKGNIIK